MIQNRTEWCSDNALDMYSGVPCFKSRTGHRYTGSSSVPSYKFQNCSSIMWGLEMGTDVARRIFLVLDRSLYTNLYIVT
jgi:hypothetical protein